MDDLIGCLMVVADMVAVDPTAGQLVEAVVVVVDLVGCLMVVSDLVAVDPTAGQLKR